MHLSRCWGTAAAGAWGTLAARGHPSPTPPLDSAGQCGGRSHSSEGKARLCRRRRCTTDCMAAGGGKAGSTPGPSTRASLAHRAGHRTPSRWPMPRPRRPTARHKSYARASRGQRELGGVRKDIARMHRHSQAQAQAQATARRGPPRTQTHRACDAPISAGGGDAAGGACAACVRSLARPLCTLAAYVTITAVPTADVRLYGRTRHVPHACRVVLDFFLRHFCANPNAARAASRTRWPEVQTYGFRRRQWS